MARPAIYVKMRIETIEQHIGRCIAKQDHGGEAALRYLARTQGIHLNDTNIAEQAAIYIEELNRWRKP